jgi:hypothetical protein
MVEQQIEELTDELERISAADAGCTRIRQIPGIGPIVATAIVAAIGNGAAFRKGRETSLHGSGRATAVLDRRQGEAARHQQARQRLSAQGPDPWCTSCRAADQARSSAHRSLAGSTRCQSSQERRRGCHGQQAGTHRMGRTIERQDYRPVTAGAADAWLEAPAPTLPHHTTDLKFTHRSLHRNSKDERTVTTACLQPDPEMVFNDRPTLRTGTQRNSSWPGETISTQRPNTFAQTCLLAPSFSLAVLRRTIH